jgi:site-specific recombinase XerD
MGAKNETPTVLEFLFEAKEQRTAARAKLGARTLAWCRAFEDWLAHRQRTCRPATFKSSKTTWTRLLSHCEAAPWQIGSAQVQEYVDRQISKGYAPNSLKVELGAISSFYRWCKGEGIDPGGGVGANPVQGVNKPKAGYYDRAQALTPRQARLLLQVYLDQGTILALRDYALVLARLRMGIKSQELVGLKWGQVDPERKAKPKSGADGGSERLEIPEDVREAILHYLRASRRLETIQDQDYIFAPLRDPLLVETSGASEVWDGGRRLSNRAINLTLKKHGRMAGIPPEKLNMTALRHTATLLRVEAGDSIEEVQAFLGIRNRKFALNYIHGLTTSRGLPLDDPAGDTSPTLPTAEEAHDLPIRAPNRFQPWDNMTHGVYTRVQPPEELEAIKAERVEGMDEEIAGLRELVQHLAGMQSQASSDKELAIVIEATSLSAARVGDLFKAREALKREETSGEGWADAWLEDMDEVRKMQGKAPISDALRAEYESEHPEGGGLAHEIAVERLCLRRLFGLAVEEGEPRPAAHYTDMYGRGCIRLARLLRDQARQGEGMEGYILESIDEAIRQVQEEFNLSI